MNTRDLIRADNYKEIRNDHLVADTRAWGVVARLL